MGGYYRRRSGGRGSYTAGRVARPNRRGGECRVCGVEVPAGCGNLYRESDGAWSVVHVEASQGGWLMDPRPVTGGCPESTDKRNAEFHASGFFGKDAPLPVSEAERIGRRAAAWEAAHPEGEAAPASRGKYAYTSGGARMTERSARCIDAPCCGCCD